MSEGTGAKHYEMKAEPGRYELKGGSSEGRVIRSSESWQFFAFIFGAVMLVVYGLIDDLMQQGRLRALLKVVIFVLFAYLLLVNRWIRNRLVRLLTRFKAESY